MFSTEPDDILRLNWFSNHPVLSELIILKKKTSFLHLNLKAGSEPDGKSDVRGCSSQRNIKCKKGVHYSSIPIPPNSLKGPEVKRNYVRLPRAGTFWKTIGKPIVM